MSNSKLSKTPTCANCPNSFECPLIGRRPEHLRGSACMRLSNKEIYFSVSSTKYKPIEIPFAKDRWWSYLDGKLYQNRN